MGRSGPVERFSLLVTSLALCALLVCAWGWYRAAHRPVRVDGLSERERQALMADLLARSPGLYEPAFYEPPIGYTLRRNTRLEAWNHRFRSNRLGYRGPAPEKPSGTFRIVFVGDSWTFGMGVSEEEAYPHVVEELANLHGGVETPVQAWSVALPGYNTFNQLAALWFFFERLEPDAVVIAPTTNDHHSTTPVLPNGSLWRGPPYPDDFGDPSSIIYRVTRCDSYRFVSRWRQALDALRDTEERLGERDIPVFLTFLAIWDERMAHYLVQTSGLRSPYLVVPADLTLGEEWTNPPPVAHGNARAHRLYGQMVYRGLAPLLGWSALPRGAVETRAAGVPIHLDPPSDRDWLAQGRRSLAAGTERWLAETFRPSEPCSQCAGPLDGKTGLMGRATTLLVRHRPGTERLRITVRRLPDAGSLYPLRLRARIPSPAGGTEVSTVVPAAGSPTHSFTLDVPQDLDPGVALDVVLVAERQVASLGVFTGRSLYVEAIEPD